MNQTIVEVPLDDGSTWTGTEAELRAQHPTWVKYARIVQLTRTTGQDYDEVGEPDEPAYTRPHTSIRTYNQPAAQTRGNTRFEYRPEKVIPRRASAAQRSVTPHTDDLPETRPRRRKRAWSRCWLVYVGLGMLAMLALWVALQALMSWWNVTQDDIHYGRPRTFQLDAVFGHNDSAANPTHIIIVNLNRHIIIIELPGGDPSHSRIYSGPTLFGDSQDLTPVTAKAIDVNGDGKLDLVLYVQDQRIVFINDGTQFRPVKPGEQITIPR
jgi:hypothetical protein